MTNLVLSINSDYPMTCGDCPLMACDDDGCAYWCPVLDKEIKNMGKKFRGCPIKGTVKKKDIIKP